MFLGVAVAPLGASQLRTVGPAPAVAKEVGNRTAGDTSAVAVEIGHNDAMAKVALAIAADMMAMDAPEYRRCGTVINTAWTEYQRNPCGVEAHEAAQKMKASGPECGKLRQGKAYVA